MTKTFKFQRGVKNTYNLFYVLFSTFLPSSIATVILKCSIIVDKEKNVERSANHPSLYQGGVISWHVRSRIEWKNPVRKWHPEGKYTLELCS